MHPTREVLDRAFCTAHDRGRDRKIDAQNRLRTDWLETLDWAVSQALKHKRPIYLGEFGAYDKADVASRVRYVRFVVRDAEKRGWSWAYWQSDGDFIVFDVKSQRWVQPILDALIPPRK